MKTLLVVFSYAALLSVAAFGTTIDGQTGTVTYLYPTQADIYQAPISFTAPATVDTLLFQGQDVRNTIGGSGIIVTSPVTLGFNTAAFNGEEFTLPGLTITSLSVSKSPSATGATVTFDATHIFVNMQGLTLSPEDFVNITINPGAPSGVPEPSSLLLLGSGLLTGAVVLRRKLV